MWWARLHAFLRRLAAGRAVDRALDDEIQAYLQEDIDARIRAGAEPDEARRAALAELGGVEQVKERVRDVRTGAGLDALVQDLRYGVRTLARTPGYSLSVIGSLSLGIAGVVAGIAFANGVMFRPFPGVRDQGELVEVAIRGCARSHSGCLPLDTTLEDYAALRDVVTGLHDLAASTAADVAAGLPEARSLRASLVTPTYFDVLGATAALGRTFSSDDARPASAGAAVIAHHLWVAEFDSDPSVLGRAMRVADQDVTIVGVAREGFAGLDVRIGRPGPDLWLPMPLADRVANASPWSAAPPAGERFFRYIGRLAPGGDVNQIQAQAEVVAARLAGRRSLYGLRPTGAAFPVRMYDRAEMAPFVGVVLAVPLIVLVIACVNAANLLLARGSARGHEIAVRLAIGAGRSRIVRQLLTETLLLALAAAAAALPLVSWTVQIAERYLTVPMPIDAGVLAFTLLAAGTSAAACGLLPAFRATAQAPATAFTPAQSTGATRIQTRARRAIVVVQAALSLGLLAGGAQLISAFEGLDRAAGTPSDRLLIASFDLRQLNFTPAQAGGFYQELLRRVSGLPQVEAAGIASPHAIWTFHRMEQALVVWRDTDLPREGVHPLGGYAGGDLVRALGLRVLQGRTFTDDDRHGGPPRVAIVTRPFADRLLHGQALGAALRVAPRGQPYTSAIEVRVVGVIEPAQEPSTVREPPFGAPTILLPSPLEPNPALALYVRTREPADASAPAIRDVVRQVDARVPIRRLESLAQADERLLLPQNTLARGTGVLGLVALLLAAWGLYGVVSYMVSLRSREFAVRLALGARPRTLLTMVLRQAMTMAGIGAALGGAAAVAIGRVIQAEVYAPDGPGPAAVLGPGAVLIAAMLIAGLMPASRAARVNLLMLLKEN